MTQKLQTYTKYKSSGVDWLGDIPADWTLLKNRSVVSRRRGEFNKSDDTPVLTLRIRGVRVKTDLSFGKSTDSYVGHQLVYPGDLVFTPRDFDQTPILSGVADNFGCISNLYFVLKTKPEVDGKFLNYYWWGLKYGVDYFKNFSSGMRFSFNYFQFKEIPFLKPPLKTQKQIANFLDEKTKIIDELVAKKERLIELLREKRAALITRAVTRGLDPHAKLKSSGIDGSTSLTTSWLGNIPEGWGVKKLKLVTNIHASNVDKQSYEGEQKVLLCNYIDVYKNEFINNALPFMTATASIQQIKKLGLRIGDVLITKDSETANDIGVPAYVREKVKNLVCGYHLYLIRADSRNIIGEYLFRFLQSKNVNGYFETRANGVTRFGLGSYAVKSIFIPVPPIVEQKQIADFLDAETAKIDKAVALIESQIEKLKEYRSSLIYHAVTGKIKI